MDHVVSLLSQHGLVAVFLAVFIEQVGAPLPSLPFLLLAGATMATENCVRQSEVNFARFGAGSLVIAKFIPGLSVLAPPLAGALGMGVLRFALYNVMGALLWAGGGVGAGRDFHTEILQFLEVLGHLGGMAFLLFGLVLSAYLAVLAWRRQRVSQQMARVPRIPPDELKALMDGKAWSRAGHPFQAHPNPDRKQAGRP